MADENNQKQNDLITQGNLERLEAGLYVPYKNIETAGDAVKQRVDEAVKNENKRIKALGISGGSNEGVEPPSVPEKLCNNPNVCR